VDPPYAIGTPNLWADPTADISSHFTRWFDNSEGKDISNNSDHDFIFVEFINKLSKILNISQVVWISEHKPTIIAGIKPIEVCWLIYSSSDSKTISSCLHDINVLWEDVLGQEVFVSFGIMDNCRT